jgi:type IV pilus assembly protein PilM
MDNIEKVANFYYSSGFNKRIDCIYLYGGGSRISGITEYVRATMNTETRQFTWEQINNVANPNDELKQNADLYVNAISLLLRKE